MISTSCLAIWLTNSLATNMFPRILKLYKRQDQKMSAAASFLVEAV